MKATARKTGKHRPATAKAEDNQTRKYIDHSLVDQPLDPKVKADILSQVEERLDMIGNRACLSCVELWTHEWLSPPNPYHVFRLQIALRRDGI